MRFFAYMAFCLLLPCAIVADDVADDDKTTPEAAESDADGGVDAAADGGGLDSGFERFKTILDRMPFGRPPPGFDPDSPGGASGSGSGDGAEGENAVEVSEMEQQILSSVRVSALNVTPAGVVTVGFTDSSVQPPRNYFMEVGEKRGEWTVVEADPDPEKKTVKLSKNGVEATLKLGGNNPQDGKGSAPNNGRPALAGGPGTRLPFRPTGMGRMGPTGGSTGEGVANPEQRLTGIQLARARQERRRQEMEAEAAQRRQAFEQAQKEREQEAEERKAQRAQLAQIQEELRRQREERQAEEARRAAAGEAEQP